MSAESTEHTFPTEVIDDETVDASQDEVQDAGQESENGPEKGVTASRLEEEGDVAADYLEELLDIADIDGDIDIEVRNGRTYISIVAEEESAGLENLVGHDGEVLEALQELTPWPFCPRRRTGPAWCWTSMATARNAPATCKRSQKTPSPPLRSPARPWHWRR